MALFPVYKFLATLPFPISSDRLPFSSRVTSLSADFFTEVFNSTQFLPENELEQFQNNRLASLLTYARKNAPFFEEYLAGAETTEDFYQLPPLTKEIMRKEFDKKTVVTGDSKNYGVPQFTSGSTGTPFHFYLDKRAAPRARARYRRMIQWCGRKETDTAIRLMPRDFFGHEGEDVFFQCLDPEDLESKLPSFSERYSGESLIVLSRASHFIRLAQLMEAQKQNLQFKALISCAEQLQPEARNYIEKVLQAPVFNYYASNETTALGFECEYHDGFHVQSELVLLEILDSKGKKVGPGDTGEIVVTSFDNRVMPFIRYKIGDTGHWIPEPCRCGRTLPRIHVEGRDVNSFLLPDGRTGYFASLIHPLSNMVDRIQGYRVTRVHPTQFLLHIVPAARFGDSDRAVLQREISRYLGPRANIIIEIVSQLEKTAAGKQRAFINRHPDRI